MNRINIIQHNVLSWNFPRKNELCNYYLKMNPDVILLNSTGIRDDGTLKIVGYNVYRKNKYNEQQAGIAIAIKRTIPHRLLDDFVEDVLAIQLETRRGPIVIGTTYLPPRRHVFPEHDILKILRKQIPSYIFGDFNAKHTALGHNNDNPVGLRIKELIDRNLVTFMGPDFPTYIARTGSGKPDILLTNRHHNLNYSLQQGDLTTSDHLPIILTLSSSPIYVATPLRHDLKHANWDLFKDNITTQLDTGYPDPEPELKNKNYIDDKLQWWFDVIQQAKNATIPVTGGRTLPHPLDSDRKKQLQYMFDVLNLRAQQLSWTEQLRHEMRIIQTELQEECRKLYTEHWNNLLHNIEISYKQPAQFWRQVKNLLGNQKEDVPYLIHNNNKIFEINEKEEIFREIWQNIFQINPADNLNFDLQHENEVLEYLEENLELIQPYDTVDLGRLDPENPILKPATPSEIKRIISKFKKKAPGESSVNKTVLSNLPGNMIETFTIITNETISMGYFPDLVKIGLLRFIGKPGKPKTNANNYRPISLLEVPGKIIEQVILTRLTKFLHDNELINPNQYGFTTGRGTQTALAKLYEIISMTQTNNQGCNIVSRDISKAFDKVWHPGLKYKMCVAEMPEPLLKVLCSFVDNRKAKIKIENHIGPEFPLHSGVPQGSILSPALFNFYTHDMPPPSDGCHQVIFADDQTQIITHPNKIAKRTLAWKTAREIKKISDYEKKWKIKTNRAKFQMISISIQKPREVRVDGTLIPFSRNARILGFNFNSRGFASHVKNRLRLAKGTLARLSRFRGLKTKTYLHLFKMLVRPQLEYPAVLLCRASKTNINKMQSVQNRALRRAYKDSPPYYNTMEELHTRSKLEPMNVRLHRLANRSWDRLSNIDPQIIDQSAEMNVNGMRNHAWWSRLSTLINADSPAPRYRC